MTDMQQYLRDAARAKVAPDATFAGTLPAIQRTQDHRYIATNVPGVEPGTVFPGVTSALDVLDKSKPLMHWAAAQTAEALMAIHDSPGIDDLIGKVGREGVIAAAMERRNWKRDEAAKLGTAIHAWADRYVNMGELPAVSETARLYTEKYAEWWQASGWTVRISEAVILTPADPGVHTGWGGTFDLLSKDRDGKTVLADVKTGSGVYREVVLQLAAYGMGRYISPLGSTELYEMPHVDRYAVLHVTRDGVREVPVSIGPNDWAAWLSCLDLYQWTKTVKGKL